MPVNKPATGRAAVWWLSPPGGDVVLEVLHHKSLSKRIQRKKEICLSQMLLSYLFPKLLIIMKNISESIRVYMHNDEYHICMGVWRVHPPLWH